MKKSQLAISLSQITSPISRILKRFHLIFYALTIVVGISVATFMLNKIIFHTGPPEQPPKTPTNAFDQETIDRINSFNTSSSGRDSFSLPPGRINPLDG